MSRIALIAINAKYSHTNLALLYLKTALRSAPVPETEIELIEWDINRPGRALLETITAGGFSHAVFSVYIWNSRYIEDLLADLDQFSNRPTVCAGGPEAAHNIEKWKGIPGIDFILEGAAESFAPMLHSLKRHESSTVLHAPPKPFSETIFPYDEQLLGRLQGRLVYYEASRGCMFGCSYCLSACSETSVEYRTEKQIISELDILRTFGGTVKFVDRTFNANPEVSRLIWRHMAQNPPEGCFHFEIHPLLLEREDLDLLKSLPPGSAQLEIGIQSVNPGILRNANRAGDWTREKPVIRELIDTGLFHVHLDQIAGLPGDSPETAAVSLNEIMKLRPDNFQLGFLKLLPGTPLFDETEKWKIKHSMAPPYEILESSTFSFDALQHFHRIEKLIDILYNSGFFRLSLECMAEDCGSWHALFDRLLLETTIDLTCRRWDYWGSFLLRYVKQHFPKKTPLYIDLLRFDWCPLAGGQYYPDFIRYSDGKKIAAQRRDAIEIIRKTHPDIKKSVLSRAILFLPEHRDISGTKKTLFYTDNGRKCRIELSGLL